MSLLSRLFGGSKPETPEPEAYNGFLIFAEPMADGGKFRLAARIEKEIDGETKTHTLIRADMFESRESACTAAISKARQVIDESGDTLFT
ncbi:MAG: HlyU family transcriptional regulator [Pseudomonadota bacterium]